MKPVLPVYQDVFDFWFEELEQKQWFAKDAALDQIIADRFGAVHEHAARCELWSWRSSPEGRLAEILVLDQFSRNIYRDQPAAFAQDGLALALAQEAVAVGCDRSLNDQQRPFLLMPYMHSESLSVHLSAAALFNQPGLENSYRFELRHREIIERFGRYPHRNDTLGRASTPQELAFLSQPGSSF